MGKTADGLMEMAWKRTISWLVLLAFVLNTVVFSSPASAQMLAAMPIPGTRISLSQTSNPVMLKGILTYPDDPLKVGFIIDKENTRMSEEGFHREYEKLIRYFLAALTVPDDQLWVNLSPYEKDRTIPELFGYTDMGTDLLAQDYLLKQLAASLTYPDSALGKEFWTTVYAKGQGPESAVNTVNRVWVVPAKAEVYTHGRAALVVKSRMDVLLDQDYQALAHEGGIPQADVLARGDVYRDVYKEKILPEIRKDINEGEQFSALRQIYNATVLAMWFKRNLRQHILSKSYVGKNVVQGIDVSDRHFKEKLYEQYLESFRKGAYNYIKEEENKASLEAVPVKYFSGGVQLIKMTSLYQQTESAMAARAVPLVALSLVNASFSLGQGVASRLSAAKRMFPVLLLGAILFTGAFGALSPVAEGATFTQRPDGVIVAVASGDDTPYGILEQARGILKTQPEYAHSAIGGGLYGRNGAIANYKHLGGKIPRVMREGTRMVFPRKFITKNMAKALVTSGVPAAAVEPPLELQSRPIPGGSTITCVPTVVKEITPVVVENGSRHEFRPAEVLVRRWMRLLAANRPVDAFFTEKLGVLPAGTRAYAKDAIIQALNTWGIHNRDFPSLIIGAVNVSTLSPSLQDYWRQYFYSKEPLKPAELAELNRGLLNAVYPDAFTDGSLTDLPEPPADMAPPPAESQAPVLSSRDQLNVLLVSSLAFLLTMFYRLWRGKLKGYEVEPLSAATIESSDQKKDPEVLAQGQWAKVVGAIDDQLGTDFMLPLVSYYAGELSKRDIPADNLEDISKAFYTGFGKGLRDAVTFRLSGVLTQLWEEVRKEAARLAGESSKDMNDQLSRFVQARLEDRKEGSFHDKLTGAVDALKKEYFSDADRMVYVHTLAVYAEQAWKYQEPAGNTLKDKENAVAAAAKRAGAAILEEMITQGLETKGWTPAQTEAQVTADDKLALRKIKVIKHSMLVEDVVVAAGAGLLLAALGISPVATTGVFIWGVVKGMFLFRAGIVVAMLVHELLGHQRKAGWETFTLDNLFANVSPMTWAWMLVPLIGKMPQEGELKIKFYDIVYGEKIKIQRAGFSASVAWTAGLAWLLAAGFPPMVVGPLLLGAIWVLIQSFKTDMIDLPQENQANCGVASIAVALPKKMTPQDRQRLEEKVDRQYIAMGKRTVIRGEQAGGEATMMQDDDGNVYFVKARKVNKKRASLPEALDASLQKKIELAEKNGLKPLDGAVVRIGHVRFGTSSPPAQNETHSHAWMAARMVGVYQLGSAGFVERTRNLENLIAANGDFDFVKFSRIFMFGEWIENAHLGQILEHILHTPNETMGDSPKIAGMIDLLLTQGQWRESARLAYYTNVVTSVTEIFGGYHPHDNKFPNHRHEAPPKLPNTAISDAVITAWGDVFREVFASFQARIFEAGKNGTSMSDFWIGPEDTGKSANPLYQVLREMEASLVEKFAARSDASKWDPAKREAFVRAAVQAFFCNDLETSVRKFITMADHQSNTFGLQVASTLEPYKILLAARGQPLIVGFERDKLNGMLLFGSEGEAIKAADENNNRCSHQIVLNQAGQGEVISINIAPDVKNRFSLFSVKDQRVLTQEELEERYEDLFDNLNISNPGTVNGEDPVGADIRDIARDLQKIRDDWNNVTSTNRKTALAFVDRLFIKELSNRIKKNSIPYQGIQARLRDISYSISREYNRGMVREFSNVARKIAAQESETGAIGTVRESVTPEVILEMRLYTEGLLHELLDKKAINKEIETMASTLAAERLTGTLTESVLDAKIPLLLKRLNKKIEAEVGKARQRAKVFYEQSASYRLTRQALANAMINAREKEGTINLSSDALKRILMGQLTTVFTEAGIAKDVPAEPELLDLVLGGMENSLWISETFVQDFKRVFPNLKMAAKAANDIMADPKACGIGDDTVLLFASHSGQTFGTLNAAIASEENGKSQKGEGKKEEEKNVLVTDNNFADWIDFFESRNQGRTFVMTSQPDTPLGRAVGQGYRKTDPWSNRIFVTHAGYRPSEPASSKALDMHATFTELLLFAGENVKALMPRQRPFGSGFEKEHFQELRDIGKRVIEEAGRITGVDKDGKAVQSSENQEILRESRKWAWNILDKPFAVLIGYSYLGLSIFSGLASGLAYLTLGPLGLSEMTSFINIYIVGSFIALPFLSFFGLRLATGRTALARTGNRSITFLGHPMVHQMLQMFAIKLFSLSHGATSVAIRGNDPTNFVHTEAATVTRGSLIFTLLADKRLKKLARVASDTLMSCSQALGIKNIVGAHNVSIGRERLFKSTQSSVDITIKGPPITENETLQALAYNRYELLIELTGSYVFLWNMTRLVSTLGFPKWAKTKWWGWPWWWPMYKTQSGTAIATTASPTQRPPLEKEPARADRPGFLSEAFLRASVDSSAGSPEVEKPSIASTMEDRDAAARGGVDFSAQRMAIQETGEKTVQEGQTAMPDALLPLESLRPEILDVQRITPEAMSALLGIAP